MEKESKKLFGDFLREIFKKKYFQEPKEKYPCSFAKDVVTPHGLNGDEAKSFTNLGTNS